VHVPFCLRRCGYCDFNTYTAADLRVGFVDLAVAEMRLVAGLLPDGDGRGAVASSPAGGGAAGGVGPAGTVFFGGGTPTLLRLENLARLLDEVRVVWGLAAGAEVTCEANPDSVDQPYIEGLAKAGFTRLSVGMQSADPAVLATLERSHSPERVGQVVAWCRAAGLEVSVDLIYGTPGESMASWQGSLQAALDLGVDHISCYALTVEPSTAMGRRLAAGQLPPIDQDDQAAKYELADQLLSQRGLEWYEISNWARPGHECRHNLGYWTGGNWWGIGPGAHGAIGSRRYWNLRHPSDHAAALAAGRRPVEDTEVVAGQAARLERIMLGLRLSQGLPQAAVDPKATDGIGQLRADGLVTLPGDRIVLTLKGRLLADTVTRALAP